MDEKPPSTDVSPVKQKQNGKNGGSEASVSDCDAKSTKASSEKQQRPDPGKKVSNKAVVASDRETDDGKASDGIKNCFINCTYLSDKDQDARPLRRIVKDKDSVLEDKDAQSSTSKESDDSQVLLSHRRRTQNAFIDK